MLCDEHGALLIFDEVITGFRIARGGAQERYGVSPDLTVLGKVMGGGFPCAAFGGATRSDGAARAGRARLPGRNAQREPGRGGGRPGGPRSHRREDPYPGLETAAEHLQAGLALAFETNGIDATINRAGSLFSVFFSEGPVRNFDDAKAADHERFARFFHHMLDEGVYLPPSGYELWTLCYGVRRGGTRSGARGGPPLPRLTAPTLTPA